MNHCSTAQQRSEWVSQLLVAEPVESHSSGLASDLVSMEGERSTGLASGLGHQPRPSQKDDAGARTGADPVDRSACQLSRYPDVSDEAVWHPHQLGKYCRYRARSGTACSTMVEKASCEH